MEGRGVGSEGADGRSELGSMVPAGAEGAVAEGGLGEGSEGRGGSRNRGGDGVRGRGRRKRREKGGTKSGEMGAKEVVGGEHECAQMMQDGGARL